MTTGQFRELKRDLLAEVGGRMDRLEKKVDHMTEQCLGCAREFGELSTEVRNQGAAIIEHRKEHRWRMGIAATLGGIIVATIHTIVNLFVRRP